MLFFLFLFGNEIKEAKWEKGETLLSFLEKHKLPLKLYYNLDSEDKELVEEIIAGVDYFILKDENSDEVKQVLIPIGDEMQIHIYKNENEYKFDIIPILYEKKSLINVVEIKNNPFIDIKESTNNPYLAMEFLAAFKSSINFKRDIQKGDRVVIIYDQKIRLGKFFGSPNVKAAMVETNKKENYAYYFEEDETFYDQFGKEIAFFMLTIPIANPKVSSPFSFNRFHPVLNRYRPHFGVDYAAPVGTPIKASGNGKISFVGQKGGYGNTIVIDHNSGYKTLYGHLSGFARGISVGKYVKQGTVIGYVGNSGMSTGAHLHFGVYKNNSPINPQNSLKEARNVLTGSKRARFLALSDKYKAQIKEALNRTDNKKIAMKP